MGKRTVLVAAVVGTLGALCLCAQKASADVYFNDGGTHDINYDIADRVFVENSPSGMPTTVNLLDGASIGGVRLVALEDSRINVYGGWVSRIAAGDNSQVTMAGGSVNGYLAASGYAQITMTEGSVGGDLQAWGTSQTAMAGGSVAGSLQAWDSGYVAMSDGLVMGDLHVSDNGQATMSGGSVMGDLCGGGQMTMSGGTIGGSIWLGSGFLALDGFNFAVDGSPFVSGQITSIFAGPISDEPYRTLTGTLANGDAINNQFRLGDGAILTLVTPVPVPGAVLLGVLGLGYSGWRLRRDRP